VPRWIVITGGVARHHDRGSRSCRGCSTPVPMKPLMVSKLNTVAQVAFAALVLASLGFSADALRPDPDGFRNGVAFLGLLYLVDGSGMSTIDARRVS
jgi:hypothetical protein